MKYSGNWKALWPAKFAENVQDFTKEKVAALMDTENIIPGIPFSKKRGAIMIFRSTIQALSEPEYIRPLMNMEKCCLAVHVCDKKTLDGFRVPAYDPKECIFRIYSDMMRRKAVDALRLGRRVHVQGRRYFTLGVHPGRV